MNKFFANKVTWLVILIAAVGGGFLFYEGAPAAVEQSNTIETASVDRGDIVRSIAATGRVRALVTVEVGSQLSGKVEDLYVDFNDTVKKGDIVAKIDPQSFEQRVLQSSADVDSANASLKVQQATVTRAQITLAQAGRDYNRLKPLAKDGAISQASLETSLTAFETAGASLTIAEAQVDSARATVVQRKASLANSRIDLERTQIRSPIDGVVIERNVDKGQTVAASLSAPILFRIAQDLRKIQIEASVDESDIGRVIEGNTVTFTVDAHEDQTFSGTVDQVRLSPTEINNVVTYTVIVNARNDRLLLLPGMTANLEIKTGQRSDVLRVPNKALRIRPTEAMQALVTEEAEQNGGGGRGRRGGREARIRMFEQIGIDQATRDKISSETRAVFQQIRSQAQAGGDRSQIRAQVQARQEKIMRDNLTDEQFQKMQQLQRAAAEVRPGKIWVQDAAGILSQVNVRLGISDDKFTEIVGGTVEEGANIVTRVRRAS